jgi:hypothetical protein
MRTGTGMGNSKRNEGRAAEKVARLEAVMKIFEEHGVPDALMYRMRHTLATRFSVDLLSDFETALRIVRTPPAPAVKLAEDGYG